MAPTGQMGMQILQFSQVSVSITNCVVPGKILFVGHTNSQALQLVQVF